MPLAATGRGNPAAAAVVPKCRSIVDVAVVGRRRPRRRPSSPSNLKPRHRLVSDVTCSAESRDLTDRDAAHLLAAVDASRASDGRVAPHPRSGCVIVDERSAKVLSKGHTAGEGATPAEVVAVSSLGNASSSSSSPLTVYLSLEPDASPAGAGALSALLALGGDRTRLVLGMLHPLAHARGRAAQALASAGFDVRVLGDDGLGRSPSDRRSLLSAARAASLEANEGLLARAATGRPLGLLKYAMTLDGKIATSAGHAAWVSSPESRARVFAARARANAVVVGGNTVRRDNPRLTNREVFPRRNDDGVSSSVSHSGQADANPGNSPKSKSTPSSNPSHDDDLLFSLASRHTPLRICMSRTLDLPADAALWDTSQAPTVVATQRGARPDVQKLLSQRGVEVVEFDHLCPGALADWCAARGHLHVLWECGGTLAAPALSERVIHKVMAFVAPKIIGGGSGGGGGGSFSASSGGFNSSLASPRSAPTPVGDLGLYEMTQALPVEPASNYSPATSDLLLDGHELLTDFWKPADAWEIVGPDVLFSGYLSTFAPRGPPGLDAAASEAASAAGAIPAAAAPARAAPLRAWPAGARSSLAGGAGATKASTTTTPATKASSSSLLPAPAPVAFFKSWDSNGELSNFSAHPISAPLFEPVGCSGGSSPGSENDDDGGGDVEWATVEHFYQAQKFSHGPRSPGSGSSTSSNGDSEKLSASRALVEAIRAAPTPVDAASLGRAAQRSRPSLVRSDWESGDDGTGNDGGGAKLAVMRFALRRKFLRHEDAREALLSTHPRPIAEASPSDHFWGRGVDGSGRNLLGELLVELREELMQEEEEKKSGVAAVNEHNDHQHVRMQQETSSETSTKTRIVR